MARKSKAEVIGEVPVPEVVVSASNEPKKTAWDVLNREGAYVRTYSIQDQGENAEALAHQFAGKIGGSVR